MSITTTLTNPQHQLIPVINFTYEDLPSSAPQNPLGRKISWVDVENQENSLFLKINTAIMVASYSLGIISHIKGSTCIPGERLETIGFTCGTFEAVVLLIYLTVPKIENYFKSKNGPKTLLAESLQGRVTKLDKDYDRSLWLLALSISGTNLLFATISFVFHPFLPVLDKEVEVCRSAQKPVLWGYLGLGILGTLIPLVWQRHLGKIKPNF